MFVCDQFVTHTHRFMIYFFGKACCCCFKDDGNSTESGVTYEQALLARYAQDDNHKNNNHHSSGGGDGAGGGSGSGSGSRSHSVVHTRPTVALAGAPTYRLPHHPRYSEIFSNPLYKPVWFKAFGRLRYTTLVRSFLRHVKGKLPSGAMFPLNKHPSHCVVSSCLLVCMRLYCTHPICDLHVRSCPALVVGSSLLLSPSWTTTRQTWRSHCHPCHQTYRCDTV